MENCSAFNSVVGSIRHFSNTNSRMNIDVTVSCWWGCIFTLAEFMFKIVSRRSKAVTEMNCCRAWKFFCIQCQYCNNLLDQACPRKPVAHPLKAPVRPRGRVCPSLKSQSLFPESYWDDCSLCTPAHDFQAACLIARVLCKITKVRLRHLKEKSFVTNGNSVTHESFALPKEIRGHSGTLQSEVTMTQFPVPHTTQTFQQKVGPLLPQLSWKWYSHHKCIACPI